MIPLIDDHYSYVVVRSLYFSPDIPRPTKYGKSVLSRWPQQPFFLSSAASVAWLYKPAKRDEFWELPQKHLRYLEIKIRQRVEAAKQHQATQKSAKLIPVLNEHLGFNMIQHDSTLSSLTQAIHVGSISHHRRRQWRCWCRAVRRALCKSQRPDGISRLETLAVSSGSWDVENTWDILGLNIKHSWRTTGSGYKFVSKHVRASVRDHHISTGNVGQGLHVFAIYHLPKVCKLE